MNKIRARTYNLLRWSERYTKTDMIYLTKGGFWLTLNQVMSTLAGFILLVSFANLLPAETYGTYRYVLSILGILVIGTFPGINTVAIKAVAEKDEYSFWKLLYKKSQFSLVGTLFCLLVSIYYFVNSNDILFLSFAIATVGLPLVYSSGMYESLLYGRKDFRRSAQFSILNKILVTLSLSIAVFLTDSILILMLVYFIPETIVQSLLLLYLYKQRPKEKRSNSSNNLTKFGVHLSFMEILKTIASQIDKMLVFHYLGAVQLAVYAIASTPPSQIKTLMQNLNIMALPKMSTSNSNDLRETLPKKLLKLEVIIIGLIVVYWIVAPIIFPIFFPKYVEAILISQVYALSLIFFPRTFLSTAMTAKLKQRELYFIRILAPTVRIVIFLIALPVWGIWGAVIGSIIGNALTAIIYSFFFFKAFPRITAPL